MATWQIEKVIEENPDLFELISIKHKFETGHEITFKTPSESNIRMLYKYLGTYQIHANEYYILGDDTYMYKLISEAEG